jgi:putative membrane protein
MTDSTRRRTAEQFARLLEVPSQALTNTRTAPGAERFEVRATADSHFGWVRTRFSLERTMMAWLRTAVSLIGFGFAIVQFFERMQQLPGALPAVHPRAPQYLGLALISAGVLALIVALWQYWWAARYLRSGSFAALAGIEGMSPQRIALQSPVIAIAVLLVCIGLFAFFAVLLRL